MNGSNINEKNDGVLVKLICLSQHEYDGNTHNGVCTYLCTVSSVKMLVLKVQVCFKMNDILGNN